MNETYTAAERLEMVDKAIQAVMFGGQSYRLGTWSVTRADLDTLLKMRSDIRAQLANEEGSSLLANTFVAVFDGR